MLEGLPLKRKFNCYEDTKGAAKKLRKYLNDFEFTDISTADSLIDWKKVPVVEVLERAMIGVGATFKIYCGIAEKMPTVDAKMPHGVYILNSTRPQKTTE
jgi:hypothetical protein